MRKTSNGLSVTEAIGNATSKLGADGARVRMDVPKAAASGRLSTLTAEELSAVSQLSRQRDSDRPTAPAHSGAFARDASGRELGLGALRPDSQPPTAAPEPTRSALEAFYGALPPPPERAEIRIDDLTLDFDNPFLASSLSPPPPRSRKPWLILGGLGGALVLVAAGYLVAVFQNDAPLLPASRAPIHTVIEAASRPPEAAVRVAAPTLAAPRVAASTPVAPPAQPAVPAATATAAPQTASAAQPMASQTPAVPAVTRVTAPPARVELAAPRPTHVIPKLPSPALAAGAPSVQPRPAIQPHAPQPTAAAQPAPASVPVQPSRTDVKAAMDGVRAALDQCAAGAQGRITADLAISGAGKVTYALIEGAFAGTPQGSCMARALRGAQFPQFSAPSLRVRYPFVF